MTVLNLCFFPMNFSWLADYAFLVPLPCFAVFNWFHSVTWVYTGNPACSTEALLNASVDRGVTNTELSMVDVLMIQRSYLCMYEDELEFKVLVVLPPLLFSSLLTPLSCCLHLGYPIAFY